MDQSRSDEPDGAWQGIWIGSVVPKRHARRAVTRSLFKRLMRSTLAAGAAELAPGLWVLRLRAPFDPVTYPSAASDALRQAARAELAVLMARLREARA